MRVRRGVALAEPETRFAASAVLLPVLGSVHWVFRGMAAMLAAGPRHQSSLVPCAGRLFGM